MSDLALSAAHGKAERDARAFWIRLWFLGTALLVFAMVFVGGATRLTDSGLSIVEWRPITGILPPLTESAWEAELEKYRQIPQYQLINKGMSLADFKQIYWWEWAHRFLGRLIGIVFAVPLALFWAFGWLDRRLKLMGLGFLALGGLQGAIGWYMVSSGLADRVDVSQYRLALHLGMAAVIFALLVWAARSVAGARPRAAVPPALAWGSVLVAGLLFLQITVGAFVAGLDAGLTYVTWPLMDGELVPDGLFLQSPWWANLFENVLTVQFNHRMGAYLLLAVATYHAWSARRALGDDPGSRRAMLLAGGLWVQAAIGIATLLSLVHLPIALLHQAVAFALLALAVVHAGELGRRATAPASIPSGQLP